MSQQEQQDLQDVRARISFGLDVKQFMGGPIGQRLAANANARIFQAQEALATVDAEDPKAIRALQNKIAAAAAFLEWMDEFVTDGEQAEIAFQNAEIQQD